MHNYVAPPPFDTPIKTNDMTKILGEKDVAFIKKHELTHDSKVAQKFIKFAHYAGVKGLEKVLLILWAVHFYVGKEEGAMEKKKKELGVEPVKLTLEMCLDLQEKFPFIKNTKLGNIEDCFPK